MSYRCCATHSRIFRSRLRSKRHSIYKIVRQYSVNMQVIFVCGSARSNWALLLVRVCVSSQTPGWATEQPSLPCVSHNHLCAFVPSFSIQPQTLPCHVHPSVSVSSYPGTNTVWWRGAFSTPAKLNRGAQSARATFQFRRDLRSFAPPATHCWEPLGAAWDDSGP